MQSPNRMRTLWRALSQLFFTRARHRSSRWAWAVLCAGWLSLAVLFPQNWALLLGSLLVTLSASGLVRVGRVLGRRERQYVSQRVPVWVRRAVNGQPEVLVVDDDPSIAAVIRDMLELSGYRVTVAGGGPEALIRLNQQRFDLVLCDLMMPVLNGFGLSELVAVWDGRPPMVAVTAFPVPRDATARRGFDAYVSKPFDMDELLDVADRLTGRTPQLAA